MFILAVLLAIAGSTLFVDPAPTLASPAPEVMR